MQGKQEQETFVLQRPQQRPVTITHQNQQEGRRFVHAEHPKEGKVCIAPTNQTQGAREWKGKLR